MEGRQLGLVGLIAVLMAVGLAWCMAPERGEERAVAPSSPLAERPAPITSAPFGAAPSPLPSPARRGVDRGAVPPLDPRTAEPIPEWDIDPNEVLSPDQQGIALAALQRRDRLVACWEGYRPPGATRLTLKFTVTDAGEGAGAVDVEIPAMPTAEPLRACLNDAFSDARFVSPGEVAQSVVWPVPLPDSGLERSP